MNESVRRAIRLMELICSEGFRPKAFAELHSQSGIPGPTAWRLLKTLEAEGWAKCNGDSVAAQWSAGDALLRFAHAHRRGALQRVHAIESDYQRISGEELR